PENRAHVVPEPFPTLDRGPQRPAEGQPLREQLVRQRQVPAVPHLLVIPPHQGFVLLQRHARVPPRQVRSPVPASRAVSRAFTSGQSPRTMLYRTLSRTRSPCVTMCARRTPSFTAPSLSMAACDRVLRASVQSATRFNPSTSNACASSSSLHSGFTRVP